MNTHVLSATLKDNAKERLTGHYGLLIGSQLTISCITIVLTFILSGIIAVPVRLNAGSLFLSTAFTYAISLLVGTLTGVLQVGLSLIYLKFACGNSNARFSDIFYGYQNGLQTALGISFIAAVVGILPSLFSDIFYNIYVLTGVEMYWIISSFGELVIQIFCVFISLFLFPCYYLMLDFPGKSTKEILRLSLQVMKGHKGKLFYITLSFLPLELLSIISIIGGFWVAPYVNMTNALLFFEIMKKEDVVK